MPGERKTLGNTNGPWLVGFKLCIVLVPIVLAWGGWVSVNLIELRTFQLAGDRFTQEEADLMYRNLDARLDALPPPHVGEAIRENTKAISQTKDLLQEFEREFSSSFVRKDELKSLLNP